MFLQPISYSSPRGGISQVTEKGEVRPQKWSAYWPLIGWQLLTRLRSYKFTGLWLADSYSEASEVISLMDSDWPAVPASYWLTATHKSQKWSAYWPLIGWQLLTSLRSDELPGPWLASWACLWLADSCSQLTCSQVTASFLLVQQARVMDSGHYACHASVGRAARVTVHIIRSECQSPAVTPEKLICLCIWP